MTPSVGAVVTLVRLEGVACEEVRALVGQRGIVLEVSYTTNVLVEFDGECWWFRESELEVVE